MSNIFVYLLYFLTHTAKMIYIYTVGSKDSISAIILQENTFEKKKHSISKHTNHEWNKKQTLKKK